MKTNHLLAALTLIALSAPASIAGPNDFFGAGGGGQLPGGPPGGMDPGAGYTPPTGSSGASRTDFTDDEKRMRRKYKKQVKDVKDLIVKGTNMMKDGEKRHDNKVYKKGKIFKEIGEKQLAELEANNPFPTPQQLMEEKDKEKAKANGGK